MSEATLIIGGERSSGKTTLLNYLTSGSVTSPFPRGVRGRLSQVNSTLFFKALSTSDQEIKRLALKISTHGSNSKEIEICSRSGDCSELLLLTAHDLNQHILRAQPGDEPTCLSLSIESQERKCISRITEIGPDCLNSFIESGRIIDPIGSREIALPSAYIHLTSAIKPLAFVERQAIQRFIAEEVPVILFVNKCDLVDDDESLEEIDNLVSIFSSTATRGQWLPNYLCCFGDHGFTDKSILNIEEAAKLIYSSLSAEKEISRNDRQAPQAERGFGQEFLCSEESAPYQPTSFGSQAEQISVWPPEGHDHLIDRLNQYARNPVELLREVMSLDSTMLSKIQTLYWWQMSPEVRRLLLTLRRRAK